jgi:hypothetical protein
LNNSKSSKLNNINNNNNNNNNRNKLDHEATMELVFNASNYDSIIKKEAYLNY